MDDPAHSGEADAAHPAPFYSLFPRLGWAADAEEDREGDADLPAAHDAEPRLRIVA